MTTSGLKIPSASKEFLEFGVQADQDPTDFSVFIAITANEDTEPTDDIWKESSWKEGQEIRFVNGRWQPVWVCMVMVSGISRGGDIELDVGTWEGWTKFTDGTQTVIRPAGSFQVT